MKTRTKIIIVVAITLFVFVVLRPGLIHLCNSVSENCDIFYDFFVFTSLHVPSIVVNNEIVEWSGTAQPESEIEYMWYVEENLRFVFFFVILPASMISAIWYRGRK